MPLDPSAAHSTGEPGEFGWDTSSSLLYALAVGAGVDDPTGAELEFTTENSSDIAQRALPTMAVTLGNSAGTRPDYGSFDLANLVHGEQSLTLHAPLPDPDTFHSTSCRFSAPVLPGQQIDVHIWDDGPQRVRFQASVDGTVVLDRGVLTTR